MKVNNPKKKTIRLGLSGVGRGGEMLWGQLTAFTPLGRVSDGVQYSRSDIKSVLLAQRDELIYTAGAYMNKSEH